MPPAVVEVDTRTNLDVNMDPSKSDDDDLGKKKGGGKSRRELPAGAVAILKAWLLSPEHFTHPYPTPQDQIMLMEKTGIDKKQLKNWFTNARRRIWKPMLKKQLEMGAGAIPPSAPSLVGGPSADLKVTDNASASVAAMQQLQAMQHQIGLGAAAAVAASQQHTNDKSTVLNNINSAAGIPVTNPFYQTPPNLAPNQVNTSNGPAKGNSAGSLLQIQGSVKSNPPQLNKTDSHAVLMELFARDQDLVRRAAEAARLKQASKDSQQFQQPPLQPLGGNSSSQHLLQGNKSYNTITSLSSWPQFNSVSSLTNLGMLTNVKSITNMSGADLAAQGNQVKKANLAHVKSAESMGRNDSYAFLEVFFDDRAGVANNRGSKRDREEDNDVGLCLDADESPSTNEIKPNEVSSSSANYDIDNSVNYKENKTDTYNSDEASLKRAYDDALAARGLLSVSRSNEKLTDLALPAKMQRTLSQEFIKQAQATGSTSLSFNFGNPFQSTLSQQQVYKTGSNRITTQQQQQYPGQNPGSQQVSSTSNTAPLADPSTVNASVEVPATTKCAICNCINVDTQLNPCGHMFHGRCLKPSLQSAIGPPCCPIDGIQMQSAVLAVPVDEQKSEQQWGGNTCIFLDKTKSSSAVANDGNM